MEKTKKNILKDCKRTKGKKWVDIHVRANERTSGSGMTFTGRYVDDVR